MEIGIITFHGSHNHGSMLQAYATQKLISNIGHESEIINFRMKSQKEYYTLYQTKYGKMRFFRGLLLIPIHGARSKREAKFEDFLNSRMILSGRELETYEDLESVSSKYDIYLSGSDQIWSNRIPELVGSDIDYSGVFFLNFVLPGKKKISFASSTGAATKEDLYSKANLLRQYDFISTREVTGAEIICNLIDRKVMTVLDPTLMLSGDDWRKIIKKERVEKDKYIFLYTLKGIRPGRKWGYALNRLGKKLGLKVVCVSPFFPIVHSGVKNYINVGPEDFLNLIENAELVFTDSFHGTAFSVNLEKSFYTLSLEKDSRKADLLKELGLGDQIVNSFADIDRIRDYKIDFSVSRERLKKLRTDGYEFLKKAVEG